MFRKTISFLTVLCVAVMAVAQDKIVNIECGGLEEALAGDYSFKSLTIKGSIDVRDFVCINNNATAIESIDLSGCSIELYDSRDEQYLGIHTHFEAGEIPPTAFLGFTNLKTVKLPLTVKSIAEGAFAGCESLVSVTGCSSIESIGDFAFSGCVALDEVEFSAALRRVGDYAFDKCTTLGCIDLSNCSDLAYIGVRAFAQNTQLSSIKLPACLTAIRDAAFAGCGALESVILPAGIVDMGEGVFAACTQLKSVDMSQCRNMEELPAWTFSACSNLMYVELPQSLEIIGEGAFGHCLSLQTIALPASVNRLHDFAFAGCCAMKVLDFMPEGVETIGRYAFYHNTSASYTVIPRTVSYIDDHAFDGCISSDIFYSFRELPADLGEMVFANMDVEKKTLNVETASVPIYKSTAQWNDFGTINAATAVENVDKSDDVKVVFENYNLKVVASQEIEDIRLFDVSGMALYMAQPRTQEVVIDTQAYAHNIYILQVATVDGKQTILKIARVIR